MQIMELLNQFFIGFGLSLVCFFLFLQIFNLKEEVAILLSIIILISTIVVLKLLSKRIHAYREKIYLYLEGTKPPYNPYEMFFNPKLTKYANLIQEENNYIIEFPQTLYKKDVIERLFFRAIADKELGNQTIYYGSVIELYRRNQINNNYVKKSYDIYPDFIAIKINKGLSKIICVHEFEARVLKIGNITLINSFSEEKINVYGQFYTIFVEKSESSEKTDMSIKIVRELLIALLNHLTITKIYCFDNFIIIQVQLAKDNTINGPSLMIDEILSLTKSLD